MIIQHQRNAISSSWRVWILTAALLAALWVAPSVSAASSTATPLPDVSTLQEQIADELARERDLVTASGGAPGSWLRTPTGDVQRAPEVGLGGAGDPCVGCDELPLATSAMSEATGELGQSVATLEGGTFAVVWTRARSDGGRDVLMQWLDGLGREMLETGGLWLNASSAAVDWSVVASRADGGAFVAWPSAGGVQVAALDASAELLWTADAAPGVEGRAVQLLPRADGGVFACVETWERGVVCQRLAADGSRAWPDQGVDVSAGDGYHVLPRLVDDGAGGLLVFWRDQRVPNDGITQSVQMEGQRLSAGGALLWGVDGLVVRETEIRESMVHRYGVFSAVSDGAGGAYLAYDDRWPGTTTGVVGAQRVLPNGDLPWGADGVVAISGPSGFAHEDSVAVRWGDASSGLALSAREEVHGGLWRQWLIALDATGAAAWTQAVQLSATADQGLDDASCLAIDADGMLRAAWSHQAQPTTGGPLEVDLRSARVDLADGTLLDPPGGVTASAGPDAQFARSLVAGDGGMLLTWDDRRSGSWNDLDVYATVLFEGGLFADGFETGDLSRWQ